MFGGWSGLKYYVGDACGEARSVVMKKAFVRKYEQRKPGYTLVRRKARVSAKTRAKAAAGARYELSGGVWKQKRGTAGSGAKKSADVVITGDLLCQTGIFRAYQQAGGFDFRPAFEYIRPVLRAADLAVGNLETCVSPAAPYRGEIESVDGHPYCNAPEEYLQALRYAGFDLLTNANNHVLDTGAAGLYDTDRLLDRYGFARGGTRLLEKEPRFTICEVNGIRVGFAAFATYFNRKDGYMTAAGRKTALNVYSKALAEETARDMRAAGAEYLVALPHFGAEYTDRVTPRQSRTVRELSAAGFDLVAGAHPHVIQRYEQVNGTPAVYSLGNLMSHVKWEDSDPKADGAYTTVLKLHLTKSGGRVEARVGFIPVRIVKGADAAHPYAAVPALAPASAPPAGSNADTLELPEAFRAALEAGNGTASAGGLSVRDHVRERLQVPAEMIEE